MNNVSETTRVNPKQILKDIESYHAFGTMTDYKANNPAHTGEPAESAYKPLGDAEQPALAPHPAPAAAADALIAARRDFHDVILGVKNEARALYGPSSDQVAALGLKKKSEQSKGTRVKRGGEG